MKRNIIDESQIANLGVVSKYASVSPFPRSDTAFTWIKCEYPFLHRHDHFEILVVSSGKLNNVINGIPYILSEGDACLIRPDDQHKILFTSNAVVGQHFDFLMTKEYVKYFFNGYKLDLYDSIINNTNVLNFKISSAYLNKIIDSGLAMQTDELSYDEKTIQCKILCNRILNTFIESCFPLSPSYPSWFSKLLFMLNNPKQKSDLEELAKSTSYSYSRLSRIFKELMGIGIVEYMRKVKMDYAAELLKTTDKTVLEIVEDLDYNSVSYFNHTFKATFGLTPTQMRKQQNLNPSNIQ